MTSRRERAEEDLKVRVVECEERLNELSKEIDVFRRKEVCLSLCSLDIFVLYSAQCGGLALRVPTCTTVV